MEKELDVEAFAPRNRSIPLSLQSASNIFFFSVGTGNIRTYKKLNRHTLKACRHHQRKTCQCRRRKQNPRQHAHHTAPLKQPQVQADDRQLWRRNRRKVKQLECKQALGPAAELGWLKHFDELNVTADASDFCYDYVYQLVSPPCLFVLGVSRTKQDSRIPTAHMPRLRIYANRSSASSA